MELKAALRAVIPDLPSSVIYTLMRTFDVNRDNHISRKELTAPFRPHFNPGLTSIQPRFNPILTPFPGVYSSV